LTNDLTLPTMPADMSLSKENTAKPRKLADLKPLSQSRIERNGIKPGTVAPDFTLRDVNGVPVSLQQYGGKRVILVFSDPHCGPCMQLAPYLVRAYERRRVVTTEIVMISRGDLEENRQKAESFGLPFPMVLQDRWRLSKKYGIFATPVAFVVSEDGRTEGEAAVGVEKIRSILRKEFPLSVCQMLRSRRATADMWRAALIAATSPRSGAPPTSAAVRSRFTATANAAQRERFAVTASVCSSKNWVLRRPKQCELLKSLLFVC
jgi:peroxiredoxin